MLRGSATDPQDGQLADGALSWQVFQHHAGDHTHPFLPPTPGNDVEIVAPAPEDIHSTDPEGNYLEVRLTATDSKGLSRTVTQKLAPNTVDVVFQSQPAELDLVVNGDKFDKPTRTYISWEGYRLNVYAPSPQTTLAGVTYSFASWSDGKEQQHDIVTGATRQLLHGHLQGLHEDRNLSGRDPRGHLRSRRHLRLWGQRHRKGPWGQ